MFNNSRVVSYFPSQATDDVAGSRLPGDLTPFPVCPGTSRSLQSSLNPNATISSKCGSCQDASIFPKVLNCLHTFCKLCLERQQTTTDKLKCPQCLQETTLPAEGIAGLFSHYATSIILKTLVLDRSCLTCTACKHTAVPAVARCLDCVHYICFNCVMAHQFMHWLQSHRVLTLGGIQIYPNNLTKNDQATRCFRHKNETVQFICRTCNISVCRECAEFEHPIDTHTLMALVDVRQKLNEDLSFVISSTKKKTDNLLSSVMGIENTLSRLHIQYREAQADICSSFESWNETTLERTKQEILIDLQNTYNKKFLFMERLGKKVQESLCKIIKVCVTAERLATFSSTNKELLAFQELLDTDFQEIMTFNPETHLQGMDLVFVPNFTALQVSIQNSLACTQQRSEVVLRGGFSRPDLEAPTTESYSNRYSQTPLGTSNNASLSTSLMRERTYCSGASCSTSNDPCSTSLLPYAEKWSTVPNPIFPYVPHLSEPSVSLLRSSYALGDVLQNKSPIKRQKIFYHSKFGEFGVMEGQFTEPCGVAVNAQGDIIIADTNRHRIQVFDRGCRFKLRFGECGRRDGQLHYPNRVFVVHAFGHIIVTERSPTHQVQVFNQYGHFLRKFGSSVLEHPRAVTVDSKRRIIVVECKVMRVIIFDLWGNILRQFSCSEHLEFPNGVAANDKEEIFISDNGAHCVKVFSYEGALLRLIGGAGVTNYPIAVCINRNGHLVVSDNHHYFHITVFTQDGHLVSAFESHVKHAQCYDVALTHDNSVILASKDCRLYIYRYDQSLF
ncbi:B-box type zinc finger protein ncl-1-like [Ornithodoros turicata]|uniref:B-box type zinc finger protein ncl-1-like n=1 Tax=Ornithodoros turicata TaxID=34597 RepID=UPI003138651C